MAGVFKEPKKRQSLRFDTRLEDELRALVRIKNGRAGTDSYTYNGLIEKALWAYVNANKKAVMKQVEYVRGSGNVMEVVDKEDVEE